MNIIFVTHFFLIILIYKTCGINSSYDFDYTNYTINDIEKFTIETNNCQKSNNIKALVEFKTIDGENFHPCDYKYLCHKNDKCIIIYKKDIFELNSSNKLDTIHSNAYKNDNNTLIALACNESEKKLNKCSTDICNSNSDCYSNKCVDGNCITDESNPAYLCKAIKENEGLKVKCLLNYQEKCKNDNECADNAICNSNKICQIGEIPDTKHNIKKKVLNSVISLSLIFALFLTLYLVISKKIKANTRKQII